MIDSSGYKCLEAVLLDKQRNWVVNMMTSVNLSAATDNYVAYEIRGVLESSKSVDGLVFWCQVTSTFQAFLVRPIFTCNYASIKTIESRVIQSTGRYFFNVTGVGASNSLAFTSSAEMTSNSTVIIQANRLPAIQIQYYDVFGNPKLYSNNTAIRIRFTSVNKSSPNRRLLFDNPFFLDDNDLSRCSDSTELIAQPQPVLLLDGNLGAKFSIDNVSVCAAGEASMEIDIGDISSGQFQLTAPTLLSVKVVVGPGIAKFIMLSSCTGSNPIVLTSYENSDVHFCLKLLDNGYNLVSGMADVVMNLTNSSLKIAPKNSFTVNASTLVLTGIWLWAEFRSDTERHSQMFISSSSLTPLKYSVAIMLQAACKPGTYVSKSLNYSHALCTQCQPGYYASFFDERQCYPCQPGTTPDDQHVSCQLCPLNHISSRAGQHQCVRCGVNQFSNHKRTTCLTWKFQRYPPDILISLVPMTLPPLQIHDVVEGKLATADEKVTFEIAFICFRSQNCTASANGTLFAVQSQIHKGETASNQIEIVQRVTKPDVGDNWVIQITSKSTGLFPDMQLIMPGAIRALGTQPTIQTILPSLVTSAHPVVITVFGTLLDSSQVLPRCAPQCKFIRKGQGSRMEISAVSPLMNGTEESDHVMCETKLPGSMWIEDDIRVDLQLPDCRYSTSNFKIKMFCPKQYYQSIAAANHRCEPCPSPMSTTLQINDSYVENCICNIGFYGTFGDNCIQCPSHPGFNCSIYGSAVPLIKPGKHCTIARSNT